MTDRVAERMLRPMSTSPEEGDGPWLRRASQRLMAAHERVVPRLSLPPDHLPRWWFATLLLAVVVVGVLVRIQGYLGDLDPATLWHGEPILTSSDGFFFASGIGHTSSDAWGIAPRVPLAGDHGLVALGAGLVQLGLSIEVVLGYTSVIVGPLIALPIALLGRELGSSRLGLIAALIAVLAPSYAIRTTVGYFDTDMFAVTLPLTAAWLLVRFLRAPLPRTRTAAALTLALAPFFYDQGAVLAQVMALATIAALLGLAWLRRPLPDTATHVTVLALSTLPLGPWYVRPLVVLGAHLGLPRLGRRTLIALACLTTVGVAVTGPVFNSAIKKIVVYASGEAPRDTRRDEQAAPQRVGGDQRLPVTWKPQDTTAMVAEARVLPLTAMSEKAIGHWALVIAGLLGVIGLVLWRPAAFVLLPMFAIGLFAFVGGHRFLIYLSPLLAFGLAWLTLRLVALLPRRLAAIAGPLLGLAAAAPALAATLDARVPPALIAPEIAALEALAKVAGPADTTIAWWDFGYPISYFAHTRTLTDGSRRGDDAALVAEILATDTPRLATELGRLAAEALDNGAMEAGASIWLFDPPKDLHISPADFLTEVRSGRRKAVANRGDIYVYLPLRLLPIAPAMELYRPSAVGQFRRVPFLQLSRGVSMTGNTLRLSDQVEVDADSVALWRTNAAGERERKPLHEIHVLAGAGPTLVKRSRPGDPLARTAGVFLSDVGIFVELDMKLLTSQWAQLYFFESADRDAYELVYASPSAKVFRLKRSHN